MNMKYKILASLVLLMSAIAAMADNANIAKANRAYEEELYNEALNLYLAEAKQTGTSAELYYNIANTYYRLNDRPHAILYYERALLLDPTDSQAKANLEFVRNKEKIHEDSGQSWLSSWLSSHILSYSSDFWAIIGIITFFLLIGAICLYLFASAVWVRKVGFFGGAILAAVCVIAVINALYVNKHATSHSDAIVMSPEATLSTVPRTPKNASEVAFKINAGYKLHIHDSVKVGKELWLNVETTDEHRAWILASEVERI